MQSSDRYAHTTDWEFRNALEQAIGQATAALSQTATDDHAAEKLTRAAMAIEHARKRFIELYPWWAGDSEWVGSWRRHE
jgi:hypothetical protein